MIYVQHWQIPQLWQAIRNVAQTFAFFERKPDTIQYAVDTIAPYKSNLERKTRPWNYIH